MERVDRGSPVTDFPAKDSIRMASSLGSSPHLRNRFDESFGVRYGLSVAIVTCHFRQWRRELGKIRPNSQIRARLTGLRPNSPPDSHRLRCPMSFTTPLQFSEPGSASPTTDNAGLSAFGDFPELLEDLPSDWLESVKVADRRSEPRCWCDSQAWLTPLDAQETNASVSAIPISLTDISRSGVGFSHAEPLPYRLVQIAFESDDPSSPVLVVRLQWCRFRDPGTYESGGSIQSVTGRSSVANRDD